MSAIVTWLKCSNCGKPLPPKLWSDLPLQKHDFCCEECKIEFFKDYKDERDIDLIFKQCFGRGYYRPDAPRICQDKGIKYCTECIYKDCILKTERIYY